MIYEFGNSFTFANVPRGITNSAVQGASEPNPMINPYMPATSQISDSEAGRIPNTWEEHRVESADVEEFLSPGFKYLDEAMKNYWGDIRVPTQDAYRFIRVKIAGASKSLQIWADELKHGRVQLPVVSISRTGQNYNVNKFTPPYYGLHKQFANPARTRMALYYRPVPYNVNYTLSIWSEHKRDAEFVIYQILTRFNQFAELRVSDGHNVGNVQMKLDSSTDVSDKEASAEQQAKIKFEVSYLAEAWLPLPIKIVPTILGTITATEIS